MKHGDARSNLRKKAEEIFKRNGYVGISKKGSDGTRRIMGTNDLIYNNREINPELNNGEEPNYLTGVIERSKQKSKTNEPVITWEQQRPDSDAIVDGNLKKRPLKNWGTKPNQENYIKEEQKNLGVVVETNKNARRRSGQKPLERG